MANSIFLGAGNVSGPASSTDGDLAVWSGTTGTLLKDGGAGGTGLTVGTTPIASGTSGHVLYDNGAVLGELAVTGSGSAVLATSPTLTTPTLGVASGTSLALGGATIGTNALAATGSANISGTLRGGLIDTGSPVNAVTGDIEATGNFYTGGGKTFWWYGGGSSGVGATAIADGVLQLKNWNNTSGAALSIETAATVIVRNEAANADGTIQAAQVNATAPQTTYTGSISGTAVWSMPFQGASYKKFLLRYLALHDAGGTITFPVAFTVTPTVTGDSAAVAISTASTTTFTIAAAATITGNVFVEGY